MDLDPVRRSADLSVIEIKETRASDPYPRSRKLEAAGNGRLRIKIRARLPDHASQWLRNVGETVSFRYLRDHGSPVTVPQSKMIVGITGRTFFLLVFKKRGVNRPDSSLRLGVKAGCM